MKKRPLLYVFLLCTTFTALMIAPSFVVAQTTEKPNLTMYDVNIGSDLVMNDSTSCFFLVFNTGKAAAAASVLKLYASEDEFRSGSDLLLGTVVVPTLPADSFVELEYRFLVPTIIPRYTSYIFAVLDANKTVTESDETDNEVSGRTSIDQRLSFGKLHVTSNNNELGTWKIVGFPKSFKFNTIVDDVPKGPERITFSEIPGYEKPKDTTITVLQGKTTVLNVEYRKITTSVEEQGTKSIKSAFPNPATDEFHIETFADLITDARVFDMQGKEVTVTTELNLNHAKVDISTLKNGLYFVQITGDQITSRIKLLKR